MVHDGAIRDAMAGVAKRDGRWQVREGDNELETIRSIRIIALNRFANGKRAGSDVGKGGRVTGNRLITDRTGCARTFGDIAIAGVISF